MSENETTTPKCITIGYFVDKEGRNGSFLLDWTKQYPALYQVWLHPNAGPLSWYLESAKAPQVIQGVRFVEPPESNSTFGYLLAGMSPEELDEFLVYIDKAATMLSAFVEIQRLVNDTDLTPDEDTYLMDVRSLWKLSDIEHTVACSLWFYFTQRIYNKWLHKERAKQCIQAAKADTEKIEQQIKYHQECIDELKKEWIMKKSDELNSTGSKQ